VSEEPDVLTWEDAQTRGAWMISPDRVAISIGEAVAEIPLDTFDAGEIVQAFVDDEDGERRVLFSFHWPAAS
jgi:hypothetical protein